jgi:hypothetical protein
MFGRGTTLWLSLRERSTGPPQRELALSIAEVVWYGSVGLLSSEHLSSWFIG